MPILSAELMNEVTEHAKALYLAYLSSDFSVGEGVDTESPTRLSCSPVKNRYSFTRIGSIDSLEKRFERYLSEKHRDLSETQISLLWVAFSCCTENVGLMMPSPVSSERKAQNFYDIFQSTLSAQAEMLMSAESNASLQSLDTKVSVPSALGDTDPHFAMEEEEPGLVL